MRVLLRSLLIWLAALALPLQGLAAATMLHCGSVPAPRGSLLHGDQAHEAHEAHAAHGGHGAHIDGAGLDVHAADPSDHSTKPAGHSCSACAACCAGAVLPTTSARLPLLPPGSELIAFCPPLWQPAVAGGPERPPRQLFA